MHPRVRDALDRWVGAGLIDAGTATRLREHEEREAPRRGARWPAILALSLGGILLGAGVLLFVSAHWDALSPSGRFALVLLMVAVFHAGGALAAARFEALATVLHAVGTVALGAGIFLAGQIFHLEEHWPGGVMLWALGAAIGFWLLRDAAQAAILAFVTPTWLVGEWMVATQEMRGDWSIMMQGQLLLAFTYLSARLPGRDAPPRRALAWIGGLALLPAALLTALEEGHRWETIPMTSTLSIVGWSAGLLLPMGLALLLRGRAAWMNAVALVWVVVFAALGRLNAYNNGQAPETGPELALHAWSALGAVGLVLWGLREERRERINLGVAGFAITVGAFYFSSVMDKLGRSASLIGLGLLFLLGGWGLERARRRLIARLDRSAT